MADSKQDYSRHASEAMYDVFVAIDVVNAVCLSSSFGFGSRSVDKHHTLCFKKGGFATLCYKAGSFNIACGKTVV